MKFALVSEPKTALVISIIRVASARVAETLSSFFFSNASKSKNYATRLANSARTVATVALRPVTLATTFSFASFTTTSNARTSVT